MDVWTFLNWLWSLIVQVTAWFGTQFWGLYNGAANAWTWAWGQANAAYVNAKNWVIAQGYVLSTDWNNLISWANTQFTNIVNALNTGFANASNWAATQINLVYTWVVTQINSVVSGIETWAAGLVKDARADLTGLIQAGKTDLTNLFGPLLPLVKNVSNLVALSEPTLFNNIVTFFKGGLSSLITFINDPVEFILSLIWIQFIQFLSYALGYAMGSTQTPLPPVPPWGKNNPGPGG
jgi:hypothetical protein